MLLTTSLFHQIARQAAENPRLRMHYDLRDSIDEQSQRMLNELLPGTKSPVHRHTDTSEVVICIHGSAIERFYDDEGHEVESVLMEAGGECPGVIVEQSRYHSLEATHEMGVVAEFKAHRYDPECTEEIFIKQ